MIQGMEVKQQPPYPLRMPQDMRSHYEDLASQSKRSLNAEILAGLEEVQYLRDRVESLEFSLREARESATKMDDLYRAREKMLSGALTSQQAMARALAQFIVTQNSLSSPNPGTEAIHASMVQTAFAVSGGKLDEATDAVQQLTPLLQAYVQQKAEEAAQRPPLSARRMPAPRPPRKRVPPPVPKG